MERFEYKLPGLSLFFPAYNEAGNIEEAVKQALVILPKIASKFEIIIVNDGSHDATLPIARRLAKTYTHVRVVSQSNKGYGGALKRGFTAAKYEWIFFTDADLQFDLAELKKFIRFTKEHDMVIGFRSSRAEGWKRQFFATGLKIWSHLLLNFPKHILDIDCAFKLVHRNVLIKSEPLFSDGAMISTEFLLKAYRNNVSIKQIGVTHFARRIGTPTGNNINVISKAIVDTFLLKRHMIILTAAKRYPSIYSTRLYRRLSGVSV